MKTTIRYIFLCLSVMSVVNVMPVKAWSWSVPSLSLPSLSWSSVSNLSRFVPSTISLLQLNRNALLMSAVTAGTIGLGYTAWKKYKQVCEQRNALQVQLDQRNNAQLLAANQVNADVQRLQQLLDAERAQSTQANTELQIINRINQIVLPRLEGLISENELRTIRLKKDTQTYHQIPSIDSHRFAQVVNNPEFAQLRRTKSDLPEEQRITKSTMVTRPEHRLRSTASAVSLTTSTTTTSDSNDLLNIGLEYKSKKYFHAPQKGYVFSTKHFNAQRARNGKIILVAVHGTWSDDAGFGGNLIENTSQDILRFADVLAQADDCMVELIIYQWSSAKNIDARKEAGLELANKLKAIFEHAQHSYPIKSTYLIAHSHGCTTALHASNELLNINKKIDYAIFMGSPIPDNQLNDVQGIMQVTKDKTFNIGKILHFYSTADLTQAIGSVETSRSGLRKTPLYVCPGNLVYNIRLQNDGTEPNHITIKYPVLKYLPELIMILETYYPCFADLEVNTYSDGSLPQMAIRKFDLFYNPKLTQMNLLHYFKSVADSLECSKICSGLFKDQHGITISTAHKQWVWTRILSEAYSIIYG